MFLVLYMLSFLVIGLWLGLKALDKKLFPKEFIYIAAIAAGLTLYYGIFYLYLMSPQLGSISVIVAMLASTVVAYDLYRTCRTSQSTFKLVKKFFGIPLLITVGVLLAYSTVFYSCVNRAPAFAGYNELDNRTYCHTNGLPFDNSLAFVFGENVLRNEDNKQAIDWNMVDRPPLQIAASLPILDFSFNNVQFMKYTTYHAFSVFLQLSWIAAYWGIFQILKLNRKVQIWAYVALGTTGFFFLHSVFIWPKLLAASMVFTGIIILLGKRTKAQEKFLPFSALLIALGVLSHSAVFFTVIPFAIYYAVVLLRGKQVNWRYLGIAVAVSVIMLAPWYLYKGSVAESDRLAKWHFAGITSYSDKRGTAQTIVEEYQKLSFSDWLGTKTSNLKTLATGGYSSDPACTLNAYDVLVSKCMFIEWRLLSFFSTLFAFEFLVIGVIIAAVQFARRKIDLLDKQLLILIFGGLAFWVFVIFQPGGTIVHAGSYATMMLAFFLIIKKLSGVSLYFIGSIAVLQIILFYFTWIAANIRIV